MRLLSMMPPNIEYGTDRMTWAPSKDGVFMIKLAYNMLARHIIEIINTSQKKIWRWLGLKRIGVFLQFLAKQIALTNSLHKCRGMTNSDLCQVWKDSGNNHAYGERL